MVTSAPMVESTATARVIRLPGPTVVPVSVVCGPISAPAATRESVQVDPRPQRDVGLELDVGVDPGGLRVDDGDPGPHVRLEQAGVEDPVRGGELDPVVDAGRLVGRGDHRRDRVAGVAEDADDVGQVLLALRVVGRELPDGLAQQRVVERVDAGRDLADGQLVRGGVLVFDDPFDRAVGAAEHPAVAGRVGDHAGEQRGRRRGAGVLAHEGRERLRREQRGIPRDHDDDAGRVRGHRLERQPDRVPGAVLLGLHHRHSLRGDLGQVLGDLVAPVADDGHGLRRAQRGPRGEDVTEHRAAGEAVQHLGRPRLHPGALAGSEDHHGDRGGGIVRHGGGAPFSRLLAGGLGLEPRLQGSKGLRAADYPIPQRPPPA